LKFHGKFFGYDAVNPQGRGEIPEGIADNKADDGCDEGNCKSFA
jgi:hypothetical protein